MADLFDPLRPYDNSQISSAELRNQFQGLKTEIDDRARNSELNPAVGEINDSITDCINAETAGSFATVNFFDEVISDPPTQADLQLVIDKLNEVINAGKRA